MSVLCEAEGPAVKFRHPERGRTPESKDLAFARISIAATRHSPRALSLRCRVNHVRLPIATRLIAVTAPQARKNPARDVSRGCCPVPKRVPQGTIEFGENALQRPC